MLCLPRWGSERRHIPCKPYCSTVTHSQLHRSLWSTDFSHLGLSCFLRKLLRFCFVLFVFLICLCLDPTFPARYIPKCFTKVASTINDAPLTLLSDWLLPTERGAFFFFKLLFLLYLVIRFLSLLLVIGLKLFFKNSFTEFWLWGRDQQSLYR